MVAYACDPSTWEAKTGWLGIQGHPRINGKSLSRKQGGKEREKEKEEEKRKGGIRGGRKRGTGNQKGSEHATYMTVGRLRPRIADTLPCLNSVP